MKTKNIITTLIIIITCLFFFTCKKNELGGKSKVKGVVAHHGKPIPNAVVYIKFNTTEFPGEKSSDYDTSVNADADGNYSIDFYKGSYYLYAMGLDMAIAYPYKVKGGLSISLRNKEKLNKDIAVSED